LQCPGTGSVLARYEISSGCVCHPIVQYTTAGPL
jgi:hypothetical protein